MCGFLVFQMQPQQYSNKCNSDSNKHQQTQQQQQQKWSKKVDNLFNIYLHEKYNAELRIWVSFSGVNAGMRIQLELILE